MIPLTKTLDRLDYQDDRLGTGIRTWVDPSFETASPQAPERKWEYGLALEAYHQWEPTCLPWPDGGARTADVGGYGSPFQTIASEIMCRPTIIDPLADTGTIEAYTGEPFDVIFALSVLEHVPDVELFLDACVRHLTPGGLLFLTVDIWDKEGPDTAHFHWMRERIFDPATWLILSRKLTHQGGMTLFGEPDWAYHGDQLYASYSFASLAMTKEPHDGT